VQLGPPIFMERDIKHLRMMRKKARVSLDAMARQLSIHPLWLSRIEKFPVIAPPDFANRYFLALVALTTTKPL